MPRLTGLYIDPQLGLSRAERRRVTREAWSRWMKVPWNMTLYALGLVVAISIFMALPDAIDVLLGGHHWSHSVGGLGLYVVLLFLLFAVLQRFHLAPCVYNELRRRGYDVCPKCGYWLKDLGSPRCPECGRVRPPDEATGED